MVDLNAANSRRRPTRLLFACCPVESAFSMQMSRQLESPFAGPLALDRRASDWLAHQEAADEGARRRRHFENSPRWPLTFGRRAATRNGPIKGERGKQTENLFRRSNNNKQQNSSRANQIDERTEETSGRRDLWPAAETTTGEMIFRQIATITSNRRVIILRPIL